MDTSCIKSIIKILHKYKVEFVLYKPERVYFKKGEVKSCNLARIVSGGEDPPLSFEDYARWDCKHTIKILSFLNSADTSREEIVRKEVKVFCKEIEIIRTTSHFLEFLKEGTSKFNALKIILNELGIGLKAVVAFGDQENDRELVKEAGIGVAVANASPKIKKVADYVTTSNDRDGVATFIQRFILS